MAEAHRRKKNPALVRSKLIASAIRLAYEQGLNAVGIEPVSKASGVTRGALFYHFPNKQALVDAVFQHLLEQFEELLQEKMSTDNEPFGRFTRAYLSLAIADNYDPAARALYLSMITDPTLQKVWRDWFASQLAQYGDNEKGIDLEVVRFATEGLWLGLLVHINPADRKALLNRLTPLTMPT